MKHLRKFNESGEESLDVEYIKYCFNNLVESSQYNEDGETGEYRWIHNGEEVGENKKDPDPDACVIFMNCPAYFMEFTPDGYRGNISEFIEVNNNFTKFLQKLNGAINNLKEEYPNYKIEVLYQQALLSGHEGCQKINKEYYVVDIKLK